MLFHDPGEGTGVGEPVPLKLVVKIGMSVNVQDREPVMEPVDGPDYRVGD
jgi:hypothetical protein